MKNKIKIVAVIPEGYESNNRIYSGGGSPEPAPQEIGRTQQNY